MSLPSPTALAEQVLNELGMTSPGQIDVDAIALHLGAVTCYEELSGCDGRVIGCGDSAIITINKNSTQGRQRFTAAHEVGHWIYDRGAATFCSAETIEKAWRKSGRETRANRFASALLLPGDMVQKYLGGSKFTTFEEISDLASRFQTSLTSTAIKITEKSPLPLMLVCMLHGQRHWFVSSDTVPETLWPTSKLHPQSRAGELLCGRALVGPGLSDADLWFDTPRAHEHEVSEDTVVIIPGMTLTMLSWPCEDMLVEMLDDE
jgi:hypothetical protein